MNARAARTYRQVYLETASPTRLLDELYGRLLRDIEDALTAIEQHDFGAKGRHINHGIAIVDELVVALDHNVAPELCGNLASLYDYTRDRLFQANITVEPRYLRDASRVIGTLREAFLGAAAQVKQP